MGYLFLLTATFAFIFIVGPPALMFYAGWKRKKEANQLAAAKDRPIKEV